MKKALLTTAVLIAGVGFAVAQDQVPANKNEAASSRATRAAERAGRTRSLQAL